MKKNILTLLIIACACACFALNVFADDGKAAPAPKAAVPPVAAPAAPVTENTAWDFFELVVFPGIPSYAIDSNVNGVKVGAPISGGKGVVNGIEASVISSMTDRIHGFQTAGLYVDAKEMKGLQFSIVNFTEESGGVQLGIVNLSQHNGFQVGILNYIKDGWIPYFPVINFKF